MRVALQVREEGIFTGANDNAIIAGDLLGFDGGRFPPLIAGIFFQKSPAKSVGLLL